MKKFAYLIILFAYAMGTIGGIGYSCYAGAWVIAVAVAILGVMAFPTAKESYKKITE
jgi:uncharacterized membrane protein